MIDTNIERLWTLFVEERKTEDEKDIFFKILKNQEYGKVVGHQTKLTEDEAISMLEKVFPHGKAVQVVEAWEILQVYDTIHGYEPVEESDGQFTGGVSSKTFIVGDERFVLDYEDGMVESVFRYVPWR